MPMSETELEVLGLMENYGKQKRLEDAKRRYAAMVARNQRLNEDETYNPGVGVPQPITNVREVGPAGYQPGFQGGMDFANKAEDIANAALDTGQKIARDQGLMSQAREGVSSFFGGVGDFLTSPAMQRILAIMARPEFQDPEGISAGIAGAAYGLKQDEIKAAEKEMQRQRLENEARRQAFLDQMKIAEFGLSKRRTELSEKTEERIAGKPVTVKNPTEKEYEQLESRLEIIPGVEKYIDSSSRSWMFGSGESPDVVRRRLIYAANERAQREGVSFEQAVNDLTGLSGTPVVDDPFKDLNT